MRTSTSPIDRLQEQLGYRFKQKKLLQQALTHRSYAAEHNERLEFLGDGVLNCTIAYCLYHQFAQLKEGELSRIRAHLVRQETLVMIAQELQLQRYIFLGEGELKSGGLERPSILADAVEAIFGAIFCDADFATAQAVVTRLFTPILRELDPNTAGKDAKTQLQERLQGKNCPRPNTRLSRLTVRRMSNYLPSHAKSPHCRFAHKVKAVLVDWPNSTPPAWRWYN